MNKSPHQISNWSGKVILPPIVCLLLVLIVWDAVVRWGGIGPYLLPGPLAVIEVFWTRWQDLLSATWITFLSAFCGFAASLCVGILVAMAFAEFRWLRVSCYPYAIFLHTVPIVAISPLIITWFGYGAGSVIVITFIVSLFPIITGATNGLLEVSPELQELLQLYRASRWQHLWKLRFPSAIPQMVSGAQTSSGLAVVGAIVGEFFAGHEAGRYGLGYYIFLAQGQFRIDIMLAGVLLSTLLGIALFGFVTLISTTLLKKWMAR